MLWSLRHRGPDDWGIWAAQWSGSSQVLSPDASSAAWSAANLSDARWSPLASAPVVLGHARLSILDLSPAGHQPMVADDGSVVVFNGEIFNYVELRRELERAGRRFRTASDTEVLLQAFLAWGPDCVSRLNGLFAFAIWNPAQRRLFAARDRLGKKPLYYAASSGGFVFASEIKTLWAAGLQPKLDEAAATRYLALSSNPREPATFFDGVSQVPAAAVLRWNVGQTSAVVERYWSPPVGGRGDSPAPSSTEKAVGALRELLDDSVRLRYRADVPVGVALSGGLDSGALLATSVAVQATESGDLQSFTAVHPDAAWSEEARAKATLHACPGVRAHFLRTADGGTHDAFLQFVKHHDEPMQRPEIFTQFQFMRHVSARGIKVLLSGQGSDELFLGYPWYAGSYARSLVHRLKLREARLWMREDMRNTGQSLSDVVKKVLWDVTPSRIVADKRAGAIRWLRPEAWTAHCDEPFRDDLALIRDWPAFHARQLSRGSLVGLLKDEDRNSMAHGIETRLPYLDYRLVEWALGLPANLCLRDGWSKHVLRAAFTDRLPREIVWSKAKVGFYVPPAEPWPGHAEFMLFTIQNSGCLGDMIDLPALLDLARRKAVDRLVIWRCFNLAMAQSTATERWLAAGATFTPAGALVH
jgi:asparagine synthase (glutamine-hydrolysing)